MGNTYHFITPSTEFVKDDRYSTADGHTGVSGGNTGSLVFQSDGNLVLYDGSGTARWQSHTAAGQTADPGAQCVFQSDGNLVIYDAAGSALWASGTSGHPDALLALQNNGNVVIYGRWPEPLWAALPQAADELVVSSPWGMAALALHDEQFSSDAIAANGSRLGQWLLDTQSNQIGPVGKFDGGEQRSTLVTSEWGMGALQVSAGGIASTAMAANGTVLPVATGIGGAAQWTVDTLHTQFGPVGNFDGDGRDAVLARNSAAGAIATLRPNGGGFSADLVLHDGTMLGDGEAPLSSANRFGPVADYDGDGADEVVMVGPSGVWLLRPRGSSPGSLTYVANGTTFLGWTLDTAQDQFGPGADFDGDGRAELIIWRGGSFAILRVSAEFGFNVMAFHEAGSSIGGWKLGAGDRVGPAADYNGDGRAELIISSDWGAGLLAWSGRDFAAGSLTPNGTACGQWRMDTASDHMTLAADFDGDGQAELLVTSSWGMGLLDWSGPTPTSKAVAANGAMLGGWRLDTTRDDLGHEGSRADVIVGFHANWQGTVADMQTVFTKRGSTVLALNDAAALVEALRTYAGACSAGDRLLVYLAMHGGTLRKPGDVSAATSVDHVLAPDTGELWISQIGPLFRAIANRGVDLIVVDGSCDGGETVYNAFGQRYCAMSTTTTSDVGLTSDPDLATEAQSETKPATFGMWWSPPHLVGSRMNGRILLDMAKSARIQQRLYRNDDTEAMKWMLFARTALDDFWSLSPWFLNHDGCYLYPVLWPSLAANETGPWGIGLGAVLSAVANLIAAQQPALDAYQSTVLDAASAPAIAELYAENIEAIWQCLADDPSWDINAEPAKHSAEMGGLTPTAYLGVAGFANLRRAATSAFFGLRACYQQTAGLLRQLDSLVRQYPAVFGKAPDEPVGLDPGTVRLSIRTDDPHVSAQLAEQAVALRAMSDRPLWRIEAPAAENVTLAMATEMLDQRVKQLVPPVPVLPSPRSQFDVLFAQLNAVYATQSATAFSGSFLLAMVEDTMCASLSAGRPVPGDLVVF